MPPAPTYSLVPSQDSEASLEHPPHTSASSKNRSYWTGWENALTLAIIVLASFATGLALGFEIADIPSKTAELQAQNFMTPPGDLSYPMIYNITYTQSSPQADAAWDAMFPRGVGFVKHPDISPELSGLAVFHELHCVNILRVGYYAALNGTLADMQHLSDHNKRPDPHHLRHCFDYLRQALVCTADTNLEPVDFELGGVTGWKFNRKCKNFEAVKSWADEWRSWPEGLESIK